MDKKSVSSTSIIKKYNISYSKKLGRYLVAAKDLSAGEMIFREDVLAVGPAIFEKNIFCFNCMRVISDCQVISANSVCTKCNVAPLCSFECENTNKFHSTQECTIFKEKKSLYLQSIDELIGILLHFRLWILKKDDVQIWSKISELEAHLPERKGTPVWKDCEQNVIHIFQKLGLLEPEESTEVLQWLCGIIDVNTFELRGSRISKAINVSTHLLRGLFLQASLMGHACRGTAHVSVDENFQMSVYATVPIAAGEPISFNYTSCFLGTIERQEHLKKGKYFVCDCNACKDPLEGGSYLSCILCPRCKKDYVAIQNTMDSEPYGNKTKWQCRNCKRIFLGCLIKTTIEISKNLISRLDNKNYMEIENLLDKLSRTFHKNHFLLLPLKQTLLSIYQKELKSNKPQKKIMHRMLQLYKELLDVLEIVEPGISRLKGIILYEIHLPMAILANRAFTAQEISARELHARLQEAREHLKRSLAMLLLEPVNTPEGMLAKRGLLEMKLLLQNIQDVENILLPEENPRKPRKIGKKLLKTKKSE